MILKKIIESDKNDIFKDILSDVLKLDLKEIQYDKIIKMKDIREYEFELVKINAIMNYNEEIEIYLKMINKRKIKESIFCYWCSIYEEELEQININMQTIINKVAISELSKKKYQQSIFLEIENNQTPILETGTEINFLEIVNYINNNKNLLNRYEELFEYFDKERDDVLLIGLKMRRNNILV